MSIEQRIRELVDALKVERPSLGMEDRLKKLEVALTTSGTVRDRLKEMEGQIAELGEHARNQSEVFAGKLRRILKDNPLLNIKHLNVHSFRDDAVKHEFRKMDDRLKVLERDVKYTTCPDCGVVTERGVDHYCAEVDPDIKNHSCIRFDLLKKSGRIRWGARGWIFVAPGMVSVDLDFCLGCGEKIS